ncbi:MAG: hypothetical protein CTY19_01650 [Methylomonas sp.]|nr:MAG: hypothetical protein CTY19_01650 [Methylomonas sp.]
MPFDKVKILADYKAVSVIPTFQDSVPMTAKRIQTTQACHPWILNLGKSLEQQWVSRDNDSGSK